MWKNFSLFLALPCVAVMSVYNFLHMAQEAEHGHERPEFVAYDHLRIRNKVNFKEAIIQSVQTIMMT